MGSKHTLTVAAEDLSPETLSMLERGDIITDAALAEIRAQASPLAGREGWELDEDGHSHYRPRTYRLGDIITTLRPAGLMSPRPLIREADDAVIGIVGEGSGPVTVGSLTEPQVRSRYTVHWGCDEFEQLAEGQS